MKVKRFCRDGFFDGRMWRFWWEHSDCVVEMNGKSIPSFDKFCNIRDGVD